ncbi:MAG: shikimate kinase [Rickettsiales bacterium]|jgi:shikimate kinase
MMGVGKTTIGKKLAEELDYYYFDSDNEISDFTKKTISDIFTENGEEYFRKIEKNIIKNLVNRKENIIISLGGGAFIDEDTRKILHQNSIIIWLDASIDSILTRTKNSNHRPSLTKSKNRRKFLLELITKRQEFYEEADIKINTNIDNCKKITDNIIKQLKK